MRHVLGNNIGLGDMSIFIKWTTAEKQHAVNNIDKLSYAKLCRELNDIFHGGLNVRTRSAIAGVIRRMGLSDTKRIKRQTDEFNEGRSRRVNWSAQERDMITSLVEKGVPQSFIAYEINRRFWGGNGYRTKDGISGIVRRLGLTNAHGPKVKAQEQVKAAHLAKVVNVYPDSGNDIVLPEKPANVIFMPDSPKTLTDIGRYECRAIVGASNEALYCANRIEGRGSFCAHHRAAYKVVPTNKDKNVFRQYRRYV